MLLLDKLKADLSSIEDKYNLSFKDKSFLLAVSGGIDSMCMLDLFRQLNLGIAVAHCNFRLRGNDSDLDEEVVKNYCEVHNITFHVTSFETEAYASSQRISIQEAARELRYGFFDRLKRDHHYDYLCTAHHGDDNIETFFMHVFRGSGLKGLTAIPTLRSEYILRPMLQRTRKEIAQYVDRHQIPYREDSSNIQTKYLRNKIRHLLSPLIRSWSEKYYNNTLSSISYLIEYQNYIYVKLNKFIESYIKGFWNGIEVISHEDIDKQPEDYFLFKLYLLNLGFSPSQYEDIMAAKKMGSNSFEISSDQRTIYIDRGKWYCIPTSVNEELKVKQSVELSGLGKHRLPWGDELEISDDYPIIDHDGFVVAIPKSEVVWPMVLRSWLPGDRIEFKEGKTFSKKIKKYFADEKIPLFLKNRIWLLDHNGRIESILGLRSSSSIWQKIEVLTEGKSKTEVDNDALQPNYKSGYQTSLNSRDFIYLIYSPSFWYEFYRPNFPRKEFP
ncbi:tRNA lysidine(34) synthetase TilS [Membranihabitans marinus]|uniref:tRNA lysidine(34) synthetase TilS n=1 Tax=Membranihabitans marinus TaxID=1227546 RepID=UPI001EFFD8BA|nr:tRNA lysidine(34) synthetase TilS [Membranihabitans marinus]